MAEAKFYRCNHCGNIVAVVRDGGVTPSCCGEPMELLVAGSTDAATEKHVPVVAQDGNHIVVSVGEVAHPMLEEHYIEWIARHRRQDLPQAPEARRRAQDQVRRLLLRGRNRLRLL